MLSHGAGSEPMPIASQQDSTLVAAMAARAHEDGALIEGADLTEREARALFALEDRLQ